MDEPTMRKRLGSRGFLPLLPRPGRGHAGTPVPRDDPGRQSRGYDDRGEQRARGVTVPTSAAPRAPRPVGIRVATAGVVLGLAIALVWALHVFGGSSSDGSTSVPI